MQASDLRTRMILKRTKLFPFTERAIVGWGREREPAEWVMQLEDEDESEFLIPKTVFIHRIDCSKPS